MRIFTGWLSIFLVIFGAGCVHFPDRAPSSAGTLTYKINGTQPQFGPYSGLLQIIPQKDGKVEVTRLVTYHDYRFEEMKLQEVWQAQGTLENEKLNVDFALKQADVFSQVDEHKRSADQFLSSQIIPYNFDLSKTVARFANSQENLKKTEFAEEPLWKNERRSLESFGRSNPSIGPVAQLTLFAPAVKAYHADPFVKKYAQRPEFKSKNQYFVFDPTDFDFLRRHPDTLRVANKVVDPISLVEASMRRDAYAPTLEEKARVFDEEFPKGHLNELGLYAEAEFDASGKQIGYAPEGDGCLWTGMYAGSQAMRWLVTKEPDALQNFKRSLRGLMLLLDVTGSQSEFGRTAHLSLPGENISGEWRRGVAPYAHVKYLVGGNNDMVKGIFYAFAWAYEVLPSNDPLLAEVSAHALRLPLLNESNFKRVGNKFMATGLAAIASGGKKEHTDFMAAFGFGLNPANSLGLNQGFYYGGIADWSGVNLSMVSQVAQILVAKHVAKKFSGSTFTKGDLYVLQSTRQLLLNSWGTYAGSRRAFLAIAADTFAVKNSLGLPEGSLPSKFPELEKWATDLEQAAWVMREIPARRFKHAIAFDYSLRPDWSLSAWPHLPWKYWNEKPASSYYYQGAYEFPIFEGKAVSTVNFWKEVFEFRGSGGAGRQHGRIDYLNVYWMGRLGGLLDGR